MSLVLRATVFDFNNLQIKGTYAALSYDLNLDYIDSTTSQFILNDKGESNVGDYVAIKVPNTEQILFYGVITVVDDSESEDSPTYTVSDFRTLLNGDIIVTAKTGTSIEALLIQLAKNYFASSPSTNPLSYSISNSTNTTFSITNADTIDTYNFDDFIIRCYELHNVVMTVTGIGQGTSNGVPFYYPIIDVHAVSDKIQIKNNIAVFAGWTVSDSRLLRSYANELWIVDQASTDMASPKILSRYYLQKDGTLTTTLNSNVVQPTLVTISLFDTTATDNPTYADLAAQTLTGNEYSHEIQFSIPMKNNFISLDQLKIGTLSTIYYVKKVKGANVTTIYNSVLTGFELSNDENMIALTFGNLRLSASDAFTSSD
ncbi:conserved protein of unknown function [Oenococcus oeni]|uniref:hypothetical protein n=1 Tax=Oenococcus oeni TaxID=1247 RepID=UPI00107CBE8D|nr:hypothetical protein [Oenococcus oeni]AVI94112.1 hypothetical protein AX764_04370 [Oenococcus oeni]SYV99686.1 conserved hypothetical protein [Oenococcus oeni]SYW03863.1 conserved hypothetical protein [Oenococcus oeni]SYW17643.1 conserved hypothetical protein [Oenococcus oeni]VDC14632.1 conserved protein of unknown function [Oenococcus oeni]